MDIKKLVEGLKVNEVLTWDEVRALRAEYVELAKPIYDDLKVIAEKADADKISVHPLVKLLQDKDYVTHHAPGVGFLDYIDIPCELKEGVMAKFTIETSCREGTEHPVRLRTECYISSDDTDFFVDMETGKITA